MANNNEKCKSARVLLWLNFFLADIRDGLGPYVAIYLVTTHNWNAHQVGVTLTVMSVTTLIAQTPLGAWIDSTTFKRLSIALGALLIGIATLSTMLFPTFYVVVGAKILMGLGAAIFPPAIAGITLGLMGRRFFTRQVGRNEAANHAGNVVSASLAGGMSYLISPVSIFYMGMVASVASIICAFFLKNKDIDHDLARGLDHKKGDVLRPAKLKSLWESKIFLYFTFCIFLFHFANAAMLPLMGEKLAMENQKAGILLMSALILVAQLVMIPTAYFVGKKADGWGRKPIFLLAFCVLPIRGLLCAFLQNHYALIFVQVLDGIGAGIFGALFLIVIADLTKGTGRYNISQGAAATVMGVGVSLSTLITGFLVTKYSFQIAFLFLTAVAFLALILFILIVPETKEIEIRSENV